MNTPEQELEESAAALLGALLAHGIELSTAQGMIARHAHASASVAVALAKSLTLPASQIAEVLLTFRSVKDARDAKALLSRPGSDVRLAVSKNVLTLSGEDREAVEYAVSVVLRHEAWMPVEVSR